MDKIEEEDKHLKDTSHYVYEVGDAKTYDTICTPVYQGIYCVATLYRYELLNIVVMTMYICISTYEVLIIFTYMTVKFSIADLWLIVS